MRLKRWHVFLLLLFLLFVVAPIWDTLRPLMAAQGY